MRRVSARLLVFAAALLTAGIAAASASATPWWGQWGQNSQHQGVVNVLGQSPDTILAHVTYDPFAAKEMKAEDGDLLVHYQTPLIDGSNIYMEYKDGNFSNLANWETQSWGERKFSWVNGQLAQQWQFLSDWKPVPFSKLPNGPTWEPVFHGVVTDNAVYVPGAGGTIFRLDKATGGATRINPFVLIDANTFVAGPLSADSAGNVYYNVVKLDSQNPWGTDVLGAWLVRVGTDNGTRAVTWASLTPGTKGAGDQCTVNFSVSSLPWPPTPTAVAPTVPCGSERAGINVAPAIAPDGTIYDISRPQFGNGRTGYLIAVNPDLTPKWQTTLRERFNDGCNVEIPDNGTPGGCRTGATTGVDPSENLPGSGRVLDDSTSSPTVAPSGDVYYGAYTRYNYAQGHMMRFSSAGWYLGAYHFGWDITPGILQTSTGYDLAMKENHYGEVGSYCNDNTVCPPDRNATDPSYPEEYFISAVKADLSGADWMWKNTNTQSCSRHADGSVTCVSDHPSSFEWCVNAPAIDRTGTVYANSEDGWLYAIRGGHLRARLFLQLAIGAAYTPLSVGPDGKIYAENFGDLFAVGSG